MWPFKRKQKEQWEYGHINYGQGSRSRRHLKSGKVELLLWKPGEQGHPNGYWHIVGDGWAETFVADQP